MTTAPRTKTGDPVDDLPSISRRVLEGAPTGGKWIIPYTVARVFAARGWGDHLGKSNSRSGGGMPTSLFQLNEQGLQAADIARGRTRDRVDRVTHAAVYDSTMGLIEAILEDTSLDQLIRDAETLIARVEGSGNSTAGARGYLAALVDYRDQQDARPESVSA